MPMLNNLASGKYFRCHQKSRAKSEFHKKSMLTVLLKYIPVIMDSSDIQRKLNATLL